MTALENSCSIEVDELILIDTLMPAQEFLPAGMVGQGNSYPEVGRGFDAARNEILSVLEWARGENELELTVLTAEVISSGTSDDGSSNGKYLRS